MYTLCVSGAVNKQGFVWIFLIFFGHIYINCQSSFNLHNTTTREKFKEK